jgi:hypothetical protein
MQHITYDDGYQSHISTASSFAVRRIMDSPGMRRDAFARGRNRGLGANPIAATLDFFSDPGVFSV